MKNLKMFAIAVMAFAVMAMGVHATTVAGECSKDTTCVASYTNDKGTEVGYTTLGEALNAAKAVKESVTVKVYKDITVAENFGSDIIITGKVTLDLGGHKVALTTSNIKVKGGSLTITGAKNSVLTNADRTVISVMGNKSELNVGKDVTIGAEDIDQADVVLFTADGNQGTVVNAKIKIEGTLISGNQFPLSVNGRIQSVEKMLQQLLLLMMLN